MAVTGRTRTQLRKRTPPAGVTAPAGADCDPVNIAELAEAVLAASRLRGTLSRHQYQRAFTLGVSATTPLELANAYATLAADGKYCEPIPVTEVWGPSGRKLDVANPRCNSAVDPDVARAMVDLARCPVGDQSASRSCAGATAPHVRGQSRVQRHGLKPANQL